MVDAILWVVLLPLLAFGIVMFFFAWGGSVLAERRLARLVRQDEVVLRKAETFGRKLTRRFHLLSLLVFWNGTLYLTDRRLIWRRYLFAYPGPSVLDIPLERVDECSVQRLGWSGLLRIKAGEELLVFHPYRHQFSRIRNRKFAEDMAQAINEARAGAATS